MPERVPRKGPRGPRHIKQLCIREQEVVLLARRKSAAAITTIAEIMNEPRNPSSIRLKAAKMLLVRGWGEREEPVDPDRALTSDEVSYAANKLRVVIHKARVSRKALPMWAQVATDLLDSGQTERALAVALSENPSAAGSVTSPGPAGLPGDPSGLKKP